MFCDYDGQMVGDLYPHFDLSTQSLDFVGGFVFFLVPVITEFS